MNPIPSHESYMRRMAAVTAVGAHPTDGYKTKSGFRDTRWRRRWWWRWYRNGKCVRAGHFQLTSVIRGPTGGGGGLVGNHRWSSRFLGADVARLLHLIWFVNLRLRVLLGTMFMETTRVLYVGHRIFGEISGGEGGGGCCWDKIKLVGFVLVSIKFLYGSNGNVQDSSNRMEIYVKMKVYRWYAIIIIFVECNKIWIMKDMRIYRI